MPQYRSANPPQSDSWQLLPQQIANHFNFAELRVLCFQLDINPESLGEFLTIEDRAVALIAYMSRQDRLTELIDVLRQVRPRIAWPDVPDEADKTSEPRLSNVDKSLESHSPYWLFWSLLFVVLAIAGVFIFLRQKEEPIEPMGNGFNMAIAGFTTEGESQTEQEAAEITSDWLYDALVRDVEPSFGVQKFAHRGPKEIGIISGGTYLDRSRLAAKVAHRHQATILIYGIVTEKLPFYEVSLEFYVNDESFGYGSEIAGPDSLGLPVTFSLPLSVGTLASVNESLNGRREALQHIILGLRQFQMEEYELALSEFEWVARDLRWKDDEGKEVVYLLLGATHLRLYDPVVASGHLAEAEDYFVMARKLNPAYSRNYLGLGAVAFERAQIIDDQTARIIAVDPIRLIEAKGHYLTSLRPNESAPYLYVTLKANLGLGATHLLGYEFGIDGWSDQEAEEYFMQVISDYEIANRPDELAWFAANANAQLGIMAFLRQDWEGAIAAYREAISIISRPDTASDIWVARYWSRIGEAYEALNDQTNAIDAYERAVSIGGIGLSRTEYEEWTGKINALTQTQ